MCQADKQPKLIPVRVIGKQLSTQLAGTVTLELAGTVTGWLSTSCPARAQDSLPLGPVAMLCDILLGERRDALNLGVAEGPLQKLLPVKP